MAAGQGFERSQKLARIGWQDADAFNDADQVLIEERAFRKRRAGLVSHDGERPEHEDKAGFLLKVAQNDVDRAWRIDELTSGCGCGLRIEDGIGARPNEHHIDEVHQERDDDQRAYLEQQF